MKSATHPNFQTFKEFIQCAREHGPPEENMKSTLLSFPSGAPHSVLDGFVFDFASCSRLDPASSASQDVSNFIQPSAWSAKLLRCEAAAQKQQVLSVQLLDPVQSTFHTSLQGALLIL